MRGRQIYKNSNMKTNGWDDLGDARSPPTYIKRPKEDPKRSSMDFVGKGTGNRNLDFISKTHAE